jgi:uncharacterized membrane protein
MFVALMTLTLVINIIASIAVSKIGKGAWLGIAIIIIVVILILTIPLESLLKKTLKPEKEVVHYSDRSQV